MRKKLICIECPKGCAVSVDVKDGQAFSVSGHACPRGERYALSEIENPRRILTSSVLAEGLSLKMIPVRTDGPVPKEKIFEAMDAMKRIRVREDVRVGDIILRDFLGLNVNLVATRGSFKEEDR